MTIIQEFDSSIELCVRLKDQIEADCHVSAHELGGKTLLAYEDARKNHLLDIEKIYTRLLTLRSLMNDM